MKSKKLLYIFLFVIISSFLVFAQNSNKKKIDIQKSKVKLHKIGSKLLLNGSSHSRGTISINDLSDAIFKGSSLFLGSTSGVNDDGTNNQNTAVGLNALTSNISGTYNSAFGYNSLYSNTRGSANIANGRRALYANTTGNTNIAIGDYALESNTTANSNIAIGFETLESNTTGTNNTAFGNYALRSNITTNANTAIGLEALRNTTGSANTAIGFDAFYSNTTGTYNTAIGYRAEVKTGDLTNATAIGSGAVVRTSNTIQLGNGSVTEIDARVDLTITSDSTKKENFLKVDGEKVLNKFKTFHFTSWNYKGGNPLTQRHYGIMAQDFFSAFGHDAMGTIGNDTTLNGADVNGINMIAIRALEKRTENQKKRIENLETENTELKKQIARIQKEFVSIKLIVNKFVREPKRMDVTLK